MTTKLSIIVPVVHLNNLKSLLSSMEAFEYNKRSDIEVIIVDDSTKNLISSDWYQVISNSENIGYGPSCNKGFSQSSGDVVLFMNDDVRILDFVDTVISLAESNTDNLCGIELFDHNTGWNTFLDSNSTKTTKAYINGWFLFCVRSSWEKIGGFDERFFPCDYEDVDLSTMALDKGIELRAFPLLPVQHIGGTSANKLNRVKITYQNREKFCKKWNLTPVK